MSIDFSIITPSYNMLPYLKRCCASVADQKGATFEHIIIDGGSTDGTVEWLKQQQTVQKHLKYISEKDKGMYDAINKGLALAAGNVIAQLNCDEQYLPGILTQIQAYLAQYPEADAIFGDILLVDLEGKLLAARKTYQPRWPYILTSYLYIYTCSLFFRRPVFDQGHRFNPEKYKIVGDADLIIQMLRSQVRFQHYQQFTSIYTWTGKNLSENPAAIQEKQRFYASAPNWVRTLRYPLNLMRIIEREIHFLNSKGTPTQYEIYSPHRLDTRTSYQATTSSSRWPKVIPSMTEIS